MSNQLSVSESLSVSDVIERTSDIINLATKEDFHCSEGIFEACHYDMSKIYIQSISSESIGILIHFYDVYESDYEKHVNVSLPIKLYSEEYNEDAILSYLKELDLECSRSKIETELFSLACNIGAYKEFAVEVLKRIEEGQDMSMYEHKQSVVESFIDRYNEDLLSGDEE